MAMSESTLATQLENLVPNATEPAAITALTNAYGVYAGAAVGNGVPISGAGVTLGKTAMSAALVGMSAPGAGLTKIPTAIVAFWAAAAVPASFTGATAVTPPPHATLASGFPTLMASNTSSGASLEDAAASMATLLHANATVGGTVTIAGTPGPII